MKKASGCPLTHFFVGVRLVGALRVAGRLIVRAAATRGVGI